MNFKYTNKNAFILVRDEYKNYKNYMCIILNALITYFDSTNRSAYGELHGTTTIAILIKESIG